MQSWDPRVVLAWACGQESPYCFLCCCFPALCWTSLSLLLPSVFWLVPWARLATPLPNARSSSICRELHIHSSCLHCISLLKERLVQYAYLKCEWKKWYLPSGNWFEFSRLFSTLYVNPCFQSLSSASENRKCGKKYFLRNRRDFELNSGKENLIRFCPRDRWISNLGVQYKTWSVAY